MPPKPPSIIFQAAKLGDRAPLLAEFEWAAELRRQDLPGRIYGVSGGALAAAAFALELAAARDPRRLAGAVGALADFGTFLRRASHWQIHGLNVFPQFGFYHLRPLRRWLAGRLRRYGLQSETRLSQLGVPLYFVAMDFGGLFTLFGPPDESLQMDYFHRRIGPPRDAPLLDALLAAVSTLISTAPARVDGAWYRDTRPALSDAGALIAELEASDPRPILRRRPHTRVRPWPLNFITSSFIMHSQDERNQALETTYDLDLRQRHADLRAAHSVLVSTVGRDCHQPLIPVLQHVDLPYIGSTEAATNMRQSVADKDKLLTQFRAALKGQLDGFPFDQSANIIYGAGGFSGILGGMVTTRAIDAGFAAGGGAIRQIYGVSAGVLNGFFHAVQLAAQRHADVYRPAARDALTDLEAFLAVLGPRRLVRVNLNPLSFWEGWTNLGPLEGYICERLAAYTGARHPEQLTFDDIALPLTVAAARRDGFTDFLGMTGPGRRWQFGGQTWQVRPAPIARAIVAGWSMPTYVQPTALGDQLYCDGGGTFYDPGLFVACMDAELTNLIDIHLDEPASHHYPFPPRMNLVELVFDAHNFTFPEMRRRMRALTDLLYDHYRLRARHAALLARARAELQADHPLPPDFRQTWDVP